MRGDLVIAVDDPHADDVRELLATHLSFARDVTPEGHVHALELDGLVDPSVTFFTVRRAGVLVGMGALKQLDDTHGELKSMHVKEVARRDGVGRALVEHLLAEGRARGYTRVSLETGTGPAFDAGHALYARAGFTRCPPFAQYWDNPYSVCMTIEL
ncbi:MAG: GNAT family N-acetyltransferase [Actinobacteria bacterium]|nr:GNAT family N-acetyltransferase [Actinomycetota bacterium]